VRRPLWSVGVTLAGDVLGSTVPSVDKYLLPAVALMIVVSLVPVALELRRRRRTAATSPRPPRPVA
jgi:membrane-associated protein